MEWKLMNGGIKCIEEIVKKNLQVCVHLDH